MYQINGYKFKVLIDSREKKSTVIEYFDRHNIPYEIRKLEVGDYSIAVFDGEEEIDCSQFYVIERKANLDELIQNVARKEYRRRFYNELQYAKNMDIRLELLIEEIDWYSNVYAGNYFSSTPKRAIRAYMAEFQQRFNVAITGIDKRYTGAYVLDRLIYFAKDYINKNL
jgi:ERCC4-type nuclease